MKLTHPESDHTIEPKAEHVDTYLSQGWVAANEPKADKDKK